MVRGARGRWALCPFTWGRGALEGRSFAEGVFELELGKADRTLLCGFWEREHYVMGKRTQRRLPSPADQLRAVSGLQDWFSHQNQHSCL